MSSVAFSWKGLPQYAARQLSSAIRVLGVPCEVVATRPTAPFRGMEECLGQSVHWVEEGQNRSWDSLGLPVPEVFFQSDWSFSPFDALGDEVRVAGGRVCLLMDNDWRGDLRQWLGGLWFRLSIRRKFAAVLVPGRSGSRLARWFGMSKEGIFEGLYGADPAVFFNGAPLRDRPKRIIFVGQYIERKGCLLLARAFATVADRLPGWELLMCGSGPLQSAIAVHPQIRVEGFTQPEELGALYRGARILALPSVDEHWGLVVHEAALSGCQLLLSDAVGARHDFAGQNAAVFPVGDEQALSAAILRLAGADDATLVVAQAASLESARTHGPAVFADRVRSIVRRLST